MAAETSRQLDDWLPFACWLGVACAAPLIADWWADRHGRLSVSRATARAMWHPYWGPILAGVAAGGVWHVALLWLEEDPLSPTQE